MGRPEWVEDGFGAIVPHATADEHYGDDECGRCGDTYPTDDATWSDALGVEVCVPCADQLGLLTLDTDDPEGA